MKTYNLVQTYFLPLTVQFFPVAFLQIIQHTVGNKCTSTIGYSDIAFSYSILFESIFLAINLPNQGMIKFA